MRGIHLVILAAGKGSRLGALGTETPKWLLPIGEEVIADHQLRGLDQARELAPGAVRSARVVTGHAAGAIDTYLAGRASDDVDALFNPEYASLNNWYSVLLALRSLPDDDAFAVIVNGDLFARAEWVASFLAACAQTAADSLIAVDLERTLTDESMKVAVRTGGTEGLLHAIGKVGVDDPVGEYVGMLAAAGGARADFRDRLAGFENDPNAVNEWYERGVGLGAADGTEWTVWPTPDSDWVEIDDDADHADAVRLSERG